MKQKRESTKLTLIVLLTLQDIWCPEGLISAHLIPYPPFSFPYRESHQILPIYGLVKIIQPRKWKQKQSQRILAQNPCVGQLSQVCTNSVTPFRVFSLVFLGRLEQSWNILVLTAFDSFVLIFISRKGFDTSYQK